MPVLQEWGVLSGSLSIGRVFWVVVRLNNMVFWVIVRVLDSCKIVMGGPWWLLGGSSWLQCIVGVFLMVARWMVGCFGWLLEC